MSPNHAKEILDNAHRFSDGNIDADNKEDFNRFLVQVERMAELFIDPIEEVPDEESVVALSKADVKRMNKELKVIEDWYPGDRKLEPLERTLKGAYTSVHNFQYIIALHRKGEADIYLDDDGDLCVTYNE